MLKKPCMLFYYNNLEIISCTATSTGLNATLGGNANIPRSNDRKQSKTLILQTNIDQKPLETEFLIAICRLIGDKWQSKTLFQLIFDPPSSIVKSVFDCCLSSVIILTKT